MYTISWPGQSTWGNVWRHFRDLEPDVSRSIPVCRGLARGNLGHEEHQGSRMDYAIVHAEPDGRAGGDIGDLSLGPPGVLIATDSRAIHVQNGPGVLVV